MTRAARSMILLLIAPAALQAQSASMTITLQHDTEDERAAKQQLERILKAYDVERWTSTRVVLIDRTATPHSHPVLTLNSRVQSDTNQLATFLHEQFHWFEEQRQDSTDAAMAVFRSEPCWRGSRTTGGSTIVS